MNENIHQFINHLVSGENAEAKETLENELSLRSFAALDEYKKEIAQGIFGRSENEELETESEETETEFEDTEQ